MFSITILTLNSEETLRKTLLSTSSFPEVILYDTGSTDTTLSIAKEFPNVKIFHGSFIGFGPTHNRASSYASYDWVLSIDSDEILSPSLIQELHQWKGKAKHVYSFERHNFLFDKRITTCSGWHPDMVVRLYNRKETQFCDSEVHEKILSSNFFTQQFIHPLHHTPYRKVSDFLHKMQTYSSLFAIQNKNKKQSSLTKALLHSWMAFFKSYICKRGFLGGKEGFLISLYNGQTTFYKYLKLWEINN